MKMKDVKMLFKISKTILYITLNPGENINT